MVYEILDWQNSWAVGISNKLFVSFLRHRSVFDFLASARVGVNEIIHPSVHAVLFIDC